MSLRRILALLLKELVYGPKNFLFIFAVVIPVGFSLVVTLLFGSLFSGRPQLGIVDAGNSELRALLLAQEFIEVRDYSNEDARRGRRSGYGAGTAGRV